MMQRLLAVVCGLAFYGVGSVGAQIFSGTNAPGSDTNFNFNIGAGATNLALVISNSANAWSHLLLKKGGTPTDHDFDFIARLDGKTNVIALEVPEFSGGNYGLRVRTPATSASHAFTVTLTTNRTDLRFANYPVLKPVVFSTTAALTNSGGGVWHYYQVDMPTNLPGWRLVVSANSGVSPDLYVRRGVLPTTSSYDKRSTGELADTIVFTDTEATNATYFIGVNLPAAPTGASIYTLSAELGFERTLSWDSGATHEGTQVFTNQSATGGDYYFKITTQPTAVGAWRTALKVINGEADVYLRQGAFTLGPGGYTKQSARAGSDGVVLAHPSEYTVGQDWRILVRATPGAQWTLVSGEAHVINLGTLATADSAATSTNVVMGPEGLRIFKVTTPLNTLAWRLGLNGAQNDILVRKALAPTPFSTQTYELKQSGQMLVVPGYLVPGDSYYFSVPGTPGSAVDLDCRQQGVTDLGFVATTNLILSGYGYTTFRIQVPVQQIAWLTTLATSAGDANYAVRRNFVPNEWNNDAYSEVLGLATESVMLVPPTLSDGTFYVTVYGTNNFTASFSSGNPIITDVPFSSTTTNDDPARVGWRVFRVLDITNQLGALGWDLTLTNHPTNTEIAIRRNAVPGRWNYRNNSTSTSTQGSVDYSSTSGFLQRADHQADIWYVGVYQPAVALGQFALNMREISTASENITSGSAAITNQPPGKFAYFRVDVPANVLGWELRLTNVTSGDPRLSIRRDRLPDSLTSHDANGSGWGAASSTTFPSGYQWAPGDDWTEYARDAKGTNLSGQLLSAGLGNPLQPGVYYVGVINPANAPVPMSYTLVSRFVGTNQAITVGALAFTNGSVINTNLPWRNVDYYAVNVPSNVPSWRLKLSVTNGEALLLVAKEVLPNIGAGASAPHTPNAGRKLQKLGDELYLLMAPSGQSHLNAGTYYLAVVSEGVNPLAASDRYGSNAVSYVLASYGPVTPVNLGAVGVADLVHADTAEPGEVKAYQFTVPTGFMRLDVRLEEFAGSPRMSLRQTNRLVAVNNAYGNDGGISYTHENPSLFSIANPSGGIYTLMVHATDLTSTTNATFKVRLQTSTATGLAFDGGAVSVTGQAADAWRFFSVTVPTNALGWDLRLTNVTSGDPRLVVARGRAPTSSSTLTESGSGWGVSTATTWPFGYQWAAGGDWTGYSQNSQGGNETGRMLAMGMGNPLEPGDYVIGVYRGTSSTDPMSYSIVSRGIGEGFTIPVSDLAFTGSVAQVSLPAREAAYYRVTVPTNVSSWKLKLDGTSGESRLILQKGFLPQINASSSGNPLTPGAKLLSKNGDEFHVLLPASGQTTIPGGDYFVGVVSEGLNASGNRIGTNGVAFILQSLGEVAAAEVGTLTPAADLQWSDAMPGGEFRAHRFTVAPGTLSLQLRVTNVIGDPYVTLRLGGGIAAPNQGYGYTGGQAAQWAHGSLINIANPTPGEYWLTLQARGSGDNYPDAGATINVQALGAAPIVFDGAVVSVTNQPADTWRYFYVTVPTNVLGWDLRLTNVTSGDPRLVVRREQLPTSISTLTDGGSGWGVSSASAFLPGYQWAPGNDWTGLSQDATGANENGHLLAAGLGSPLSPGNYYVGVFKGTGTGSGNPMSYTLLSRAIGTNASIDVTDIPFLGAVTNAALPVRGAVYYRVNVPSNTPNWKLRLSGGLGQTLLLLKHGVLPSILAGNGHPVTSASGRAVQKAGNENYLLLPDAGKTNITAGTYYLAVVSEGQNPTSTRSGTNASSYKLEGLGSVTAEELGAVSGADLLRIHALEGGELRFYRFNIPAGTASFEVRLENRVGNPRLSLRPGNGLPVPSDAYGFNGGESATWDGTTLITLANPTPTNYTLSVFADDVSGVFPDAGYTLRVHAAPVAELNFAPNLNTNGLTNVVSAVLADNQRGYFKINVPGTNNGRAVLGWRLTLAQTTGAATLRARKDLLPADGVVTQMPFVADEAVLTPPFLTPGTWYVEVKASGTTSFTLTSTEVSLERPPWVMPAEGQPTTTPGVTAPEFGDTGVTPNGVVLPGDGGTDLAAGRFHYYAVQVPTNNSGIFRVVLEAISGNADFYLRADALPTLTHNSDGVNGSIYARSLTGTGSEYANWVGLNGRYERGLSPGTNYIAIRAAGNSNARYRLRLSTGIITDLALHGAGATNQTVPAKDFRYFRILVPSNAPTAWHVTFNQTVGDVMLYVRDTTPPGQGTAVDDFIDWADDNKNHGPYPTYDVSGTHTLNTPPLRPGHTYYLGFRGVSDATFTVDLATNGPAIGYSNVLPFYGGYVTNVLPAFGKAEYRILVPADARRWKHGTTGSGNVKFHLDQGSVPTMTASDHWTGAGNATNSTSLVSANPWPWVPGQTYFLLVTNTAATSQGFSFFMDGRDCATEDEDNDGMADCWETVFFGNISRTATQDADNDGNNNLLEYQDDTNPTNSVSMLARLNVVTNGLGSVGVSPLPGPYPYATPVTLTATPGANQVFNGWSGVGISSTANPLVVLMTTNRTLTATFTPDYGVPGEVRADYQFQSNLLSSVGNPPPLTLVNAGQYFTNQLVDGLSRTVLRWPQGSGLALAPTTGIFPSNAYTLVILFKLENVSGYRRLFDPKNAAPDRGLYVRDGKLTVFNNSGDSAVCITNNTWHQVVLTRNAANQVVVYSDGVQRLSYVDSTGAAVVSADALRFFKDDAAEESAGWVARIRNFATALTPAEVGALDRVPVDGNPGGEPILLSEASREASGAFVFKLNGPAVPVRIESSTNLVHWVAVTNLNGFAGSHWHTNAPVMGSGNLFFRVRRL